jgi:mono/diheme cytochrome c family protein
MRRTRLVRRTGSLTIAGVALLALAACGQTDAPGDPQSPTSALPQDGDRAELAAKAIRDTSPQVGGAWAAPFDMNVIAIHMALQPGGTVLYYGSAPNGSQTAAANYAFWDPSRGTGADSVVTLDNTTGTDLFCSSHALLQDGRAVISGGDMPGPSNVANRESTVVNGPAGTIVKGERMHRARWYSSSTTLMSGEIYVQGGAGGHDRPEIRGADGTYRLLSGADTSGLDATFPRNFVAPDGRIFGMDGGGRLYFVDPRGNGAVTLSGQLPGTASGGAAGAAQFRPGRFLKLAPWSPSATVVDIRSGTPTWKETEAASANRIHGVATMLADGRVLASGGGRTDNVLNTAVNTAEVWNPVTGEWTIGPAQKNARLYHGTALLLHDGRVLVAGGGAPGPLTNRNGEIYSPSYLFDAQGARAQQTTLADAPTVLDPARSFELRLASGTVSRVTLVRFGSVSHSWSGDLAFVDLPFRATGAGGAQVRAQLPGQATQTPPGFYLLFAFDARGVPSIARTVRIAPPGGDAGAASAPTVDAIADRVWASGAVVLQPTGRSPAGAALAWTASGLPPGLSINADTGAITGTPTKRGDYHVTIAADDGTRTGSASFVWSISLPDVELVPPTSRGPVVSGTTVRLSAQATGRSLTYEWNFGDGTPVTARSSTPWVDHVFAAPGIYTVTVTVYDAQGRPVTGSFRQIAGAGDTAGQAARSSMIAWTGRGAGARVWVANPDADTVAGFDARSGARVAEIPVGRQPVTLTAAGDGRLWVASRRAGVLTVIDPSSGAIVRTTSLPTGSLPYGVVGDPAGRAVWLALEGTGQLLRFDAATGAQTGSLAVGPDVRHLAVSADSSTVLVSRFVTPALPGESTAAVRPAGRGGEVVRVDASALAVRGTVVLGHSERPDFENQGRGIPNYLGAVAISPDGSQAFVPSKQDNVMRGKLRDGRDLDFQNTVRAVSSRLDLKSMTEDPTRRIDHDNASVASAAAFDPTGALLFVALETSREVAVIDAHSRAQVLRVETGRAPQALMLSPDASRLYVANFMDRSLGVYDLTPLRMLGRLELPFLGAVPTVGRETLTEQVLVGKQIFYDARDTRLARDRYMSCASCHADGGHDGRTWDLSGFGEGLRNTISLRGRGGMRAGPLHWSGNFDEVQDFEGQIRRLAGGSGLMRDDDFNAGTRSRPMGAPKAGLSSDLDALAAYVGSLTEADPVPVRPTDAALVPAGRAVFGARCASCHAGPIGTDSAPGGAHGVGTLTPASGKRLDGRLAGLDTPAIADAWQTAPYLHDGSAQTVERAVQRHVPGLTSADLRSVAAFVRAGAVDPDRPSRRMEDTEVRRVGTAAAAGDGRVRMTNDVNQTAALWAARPWSTTEPFTTAFDFTVDGSGRHADGLAFVLQGGGSGALGGGGGCLGMCGLPSWVAATLHTWTYNAAGWAGEGLDWQRRALGFDAGAAQRITGRMSIAWNPQQSRLSMTVSMLVDGVPRRFTDSRELDLQSRFGPTVTVGITSATGGGRATQGVSGWTATAGIAAPRRERVRERLGGVAAGAPECVSWGERRIDCMMVGTDGGLWQRWSPDDGTTWYGWSRLGGALAAERPSCVSIGGGRLDCFALGADRALWQLRWDGSTWRPWRSLGGVLTSPPSCTVVPGGGIECFVRGTDRALWARTGTGGSDWTNWRRLGGTLDSSPVCTTDPTGTAQCFARGTDASMVQISSTGSARGHGGWIAGEPACATRRDGMTSCFVRGGDNGLWRTDFDGIGWSGWRAERGTAGLIAAPPRCVATRERSGIDCGVVSADGTLLLLSRDEGGPIDGSWPLRGLATGRALEAPGCVARRGAVDCASRAAADGSVLATGASVD